MKTNRLLRKGNKMNRKKMLLFGGLLLAGLNGCLSPVTVSKTQEVRFAGIPEVTAVDNGVANKKGQVRMAGHFSYKIDEPQIQVYRKTVVDTHFFNDITITNHRSVFYEPKGSIGAECTYSFSNHAALGGQFGFASVNFSSLSDSIMHNEYSMFRTGIHGRFTKNQHWVSVGYRPELFIGSFHGTRKQYDSAMVLDEEEWIRKIFIAFEQSAFVRVSPIEMAGVFLGFKHSVKPVGVIDKWSVHKNHFHFYGGISAELLTMVSLNVYGSIPITIENQNRDIPASIGASIGIVFNSKGEDDD